LRKSETPTMQRSTTNDQVAVLENNPGTSTKRLTTDLTQPMRPTSSNTMLKRFLPLHQAIDTRRQPRNLGVTRICPAIGVSGVVDQ
jgi:hypothetical protein